MYNPSARDEKQFKLIVNQMLKDCLTNIPTFPKHASLHVAVHYFFPIPQSAHTTPESIRASLHAKGDIDNFLKFTLDALSCDRKNSPVIIQDDRQIVTVTSTKHALTHAREGHTTITIQIVE